MASQPEAMLQVQLVKSSKPCAALGKLTEDSMEAVYEMLKDLHIGIGPQIDDVDSMSDFFKKVVQTFPNFYYRDISTTAGTGKSKVTTNQRVYGTTALRIVVKEVDSAWKADPASLTYKMIQPLKTYKFTLNAAVLERVKKYLKSVGEQSNASGSIHAIHDDHGGPSSPSTDCAIAVKAAPSVGKTTKGQAKAVTKATEKANMLKYFCAKSS